jgi:hypothetical protein
MGKSALSLQRMPRYLIITLPLLMVVTAAVAAGDKSSGENNSVVQAGGLMCFSSPVTRTGPASCDAVCQTKGAACVGLKFDGAINPGIGCDDAKLPEQAGHAVVGCRCCAVAH